MEETDEILQANHPSCGKPWSGWSFGLSLGMKCTQKSDPNVYINYFIDFENVKEIDTKEKVKEISFKIVWLLGSIGRVLF